MAGNVSIFVHFTHSFYRLCERNSNDITFLKISQMYPKTITKISLWELYYKYHDIFRRKKTMVLFGKFPVGKQNILPTVTSEIVLFDHSTFGKPGFLLYEFDIYFSYHF